MMRGFAVACFAVGMALASVASVAAQGRKPAARVALDKDAVNTADFSTLGDASQPSAVLVKMQVLLDRLHASPGVIDGRKGENLQKAIGAFAAAHGLSETQEPDEAF